MNDGTNLQSTTVSTTSNDCGLADINTTAIGAPIVSDNVLANEQNLPSEELIHSRVMILDDEVAITQMLTRHLASQSFDSVNSFNSPREAIQFLQQNPQDILLLDICMPEIDGLKIVEFLRSKPETRYLPIIVLTNFTDQETRLAALNAGASDFLVKPVNQDELVARIKNALSFKRYADRIESCADQVRRELELDNLTALQSRRAFDNYLDNEFEQNRGTDLTLMLFDIDQFKRINDKFGHRAGDEILKSIGSIVDAFCGKSEFASRIGGDEFAILCHHADSLATKALAHQIRTAIENSPIRCKEHSISATVSIGVARNICSTGTRETLFDNANSALYRAKHLGGNHVNFFGESPSDCSSDYFSKDENGTAAGRLSRIDPLEGRILLIDDEPTITQMLRSQLKKAGYAKVEMENDATNALAHCQQMKPDLIILDVRMPKINGLQILSQLKDSADFESVPVLIMTSSDDSRIRLAALKLHANDFLTKPGNAAELAVRVQNALLIKFQHDQLKEVSSQLRFEVEVRTRELFATRREAILCLARTAESRDTETGQHVLRVGRYAAIIGKSFGLDDNFVSWLELAAQLHDVGKIAIPDSILYKPNELNDEEFATMKTHCDESKRIFGHGSEAECTSPLLQMAARIALTHHERWDGTGYPNQLMGKNIPIEGRITAVADVFDAISSKRYYKEAFTLEKCCEILEEGRGSHFDPEVLDAFFNAQDKILNAMHELQD